MAIIYTYPTKAFPTSEDLVLISDAADSNKTKNAKISSIQSLISGVNSVNGLAGTVLLDSTTGVSGNNLTRTTTPGTNTISYSLSDQLNRITNFETGTWTPTLEYYNTSTSTWTNVSTLTDFAYESQNGFYTRVNNIVTLNVKIRINNTSGLAVDWRCKNYFSSFYT